MCVRDNTDDYDQERVNETFPRTGTSSGAQALTISMMTFHPKTRPTSKTAPLLSSPSPVSCYFFPSASKSGTPICERKPPPIPQKCSAQAGWESTRDMKGVYGSHDAKYQVNRRISKEFLGRRRLLFEETITPRDVACKSKIVRMRAWSK